MFYVTLSGFAIMENKRCFRKKFRRNSAGSWMKIGKDIVVMTMLLVLNLSALLLKKLPSIFSWIALYKEQHL